MIGPSCSIHDIEPGDYVRVNNKFERIVDVYGVHRSERGTVLAKPSEGGFGVITESGRNVSMWDAQTYHKAGASEDKHDPKRQAVQAVADQLGVKIKFLD